MEKSAFLKEKNKPVPDEPRKTHAKKDTKRWCKGKVGREHNLEWIDWPNECYTNWMKVRNIERCKVRACTVCNKQFEICFNSVWSGKQDCICGLHTKITKFNSE